jgi:hypothetical protein
VLAVLGALYLLPLYGSSQSASLSLSVAGSAAAALMVTKLL